MFPGISSLEHHSCVELASSVVPDGAEVVYDVFVRQNRRLLRQAAPNADLALVATVETLVSTIQLSAG